MGFADKFKEQFKEGVNKANEKAEIAKREKEELKEKLVQMDKEGIPYCPKCYSTSITGNKKGFGLGKALVGGALTGGVGLLAGNIGKNKIELSCMKCGHKFKAGN